MILSIIYWMCLEYWLNCHEYCLKGALVNAIPKACFMFVDQAFNECFWQSDTETGKADHIF